MRGVESCHDHSLVVKGGKILKNEILGFDIGCLDKDNPTKKKNRVALLFAHDMLFLLFMKIKGQKGRS